MVVLKRKSVRRQCRRNTPFSLLKWERPLPFSAFRFPFFKSSPPRHDGLLSIFQLFFSSGGARGG